MGMSASQVRLLTITKRIHSVENEAERIQNQKMLLGLQSDEAYEEYLAAMEKKNIEYAYFNGEQGNFDWDKLDIDTLFRQGYQLRVKVPVETDSQDVVRVERTPVTLGELTQDPQTITDATLEDGNVLNSEHDIIGAAVLSEEGTTIDDIVGITIDGITYPASYDNDDVTYTVTTQPISGAPEGAPANFIVNDDDFVPVTNENGTYTLENVNENSAVLVRTYTERLHTYADSEWVTCTNANEVLAALQSISNANNAGTVDPSVLNDALMLRELVYNAYAIIQAKVYNEDTQTHEWADTSVATNTGLREKTDDQALAIAEANYEAALRKIDKKEEYYDKELAKMDQERKALTTQLDTLKTCIKENIDRTFKIFQG